MEDWKKEKDAIMDLKKISSFENLSRLSLFFVKTVDRIARQFDTKLSTDIFEIREVIIKKFPTNDIDFQYIMAHIEALQFTPEYKMWQYTDKIEKDY